MGNKKADPQIKLGKRTVFDRKEIDNWVRNGGRMADSLPALPKV